MIPFTELSDLLRSEFPEVPCLLEEPMAAHTSFRIGGPCRIMLKPGSVDTLVRLYRRLREAGIRPFLLGGGTNVLFPDNGYNGVILAVREGLNSLELCAPNMLRAQCGVTLARLASFACEHSLTGLEFAQGIPGTVGGGVFMNAGAYGGEMRLVVDSVTYLTEEGEQKTVSASECEFGYRTSLFQKTGGVVLSADFILQSGNQDTIRAKMQELAAKRREKQPLEYPSAGSAFRRPEGYFAGALIEQSGLKGFRVGDAAVSEKHAGFIINLGKATAEDVLGVITAVRAKVLADSGVNLQPEIRLISNS